MNKFLSKNIFFSIVFFLCSPFLWAQNAQAGSSSVDQTMRSHDKIYVVMAVCIVILLVFFLYLIRIDMKVSKKEKTF